ncbi:MAG: S1 RNA-binding domain-containing protein, partial [Janthinobacterium lividum]
TIRGIIDATGVKIDVEDSGRVNVASSDADGLTKAIQMISDLTAVPEVGKTYLGKVVRLAEFGAFVEIFPGTDGLLHVSEIAEHRVKEVKDELRDGDQVLVKVLAIEGNRIKLSRKAVLREQRAKLGLPEVPEGGGGESSRGRSDRPERGERAARPETSPAEETITIEGGEDFDVDEEIEGDEEGAEEGELVTAPETVGGQPGDSSQETAARRRRRRGRRPGSGSGAPPTAPSN